jgi:hypothetical protein
MKVDWIEKDEGDLHIPEFAHGFLLSQSYMIFDEVLQAGELDDWQQINDVPLSAGKHCDYADYDLNFWFGEYDDKWYCTAYEIWRDEEGVAHTKTDEYRRLW